jgi:UDP-N-acetyl-D-galactosamine dehydrogenase
MGTTFKENVSDIRNSKIAELFYELKEFGMQVEVIDPYAEPDEVFKEYGYKLHEKPSEKYNAIIVAVNHKEYSIMNEAEFMELMVPGALLVDLKGIFRNKISQLNYWSL